MDKINNQAKDAKAQARKLSPELNEFLHMLSALEGQMAVQPGTAIR